MAAPLSAAATLNRSARLGRDLVRSVPGAEREVDELEREAA